MRENDNRATHKSRVVFGQNSSLDEMNFILRVSLDMLNISHAKKAQDLATETNYRTFLHEYTTLPTDMNVAWAKKAYGLQSDVSLIVWHLKIVGVLWEGDLLKFSCKCASVETVQVWSELDEGRRLGGLAVSGRPAGEESRRSRQRGNLRPAVTRHALLKSAASLGM